MKKRIISATLAVAALAVSAGCVADITPTETTVISDTTSITEAQSSEPATTSCRDYDKGEYSCFDNALFIGNSRVETVRELGLARNADIFAKVGLTIRTVYDSSMDSSGVSIMDKIKSSSYDKVIFSFGDNETGWLYLDVFKKEYSELIKEVESMQPDAEIYIQKVFPISEYAEGLSENIQNGYNLVNIEKINNLIDEIAEETNAKTIPVPDSFVDSNGYLPDSAASDGVHFGKKYCLKWLEYVADFVEGNK